jgi:hypothetical protein
MMSVSELNEIISSPTSTASQKNTAQSLIDAQSPVSVQSGEFDSNAEMLASHIRGFADPKFRAQCFSGEREKSVNGSVWLKSFTPEREALRAKRRVYGPNGGDIVNYCYDEDM